MVQQIPGEEGATEHRQRGKGALGHGQERVGIPPTLATGRKREKVSGKFIDLVAGN